MINLSKKLSYFATAVCLAVGSAGTSLAADSVHLPAKSSLAKSLNQLLPVAGTQGFQEVRKGAVITSENLQLVCTSHILVLRNGDKVEQLQGCTVDVGVTEAEGLPQLTLLDLINKAASAAAP